MPGCPLRLHLSSARTSQLGLSAILACLSLALLVGKAQAAGDASGVVVEVSEELEGRVEQKWVGRLIRLELADLVFPTPYGIKSLRSTPAFIRITDDSRGIGVELWHRGVFEGRRTVSSGGGERLVARRIALVSAELARGLVRRRLKAAVAQRRDELVARRASERRRGRPLFARWLLDVGALARSLESKTLAAGPVGRVALLFDRGPLVSLGLATLGGATPGLDDVGASLAYELNLGAAYRWALGAAHSIEVGAQLGVTELHLGRSGSRLPHAQPAVGLLPSASLASSYVFKLTPRIGVLAGADAGLALHRVALSGDPKPERVGGLMLGATLGLRFELDAAGGSLH